jgi:hypothetical protein
MKASIEAAPSKVPKKNLASKGAEIRWRSWRRVEKSTRGEQ